MLFINGFKFNKFDKDIPQSIRKEHSQIYPLYKKVEPDLIMLSAGMYQIEQDFIIPECDKLEMSLSQTVNVSRRIINKYLGNNFLMYFEELMNSYAEYVKMVEKQDLTLIKSKKRR